ncbi:GNAT family N-acetyltransferase [Microbacterium imperiale]|uniref:GNAT family N-acetyltransferase n=1 Tax=Microbacterium imperiale TaxID=33884 RepID=A0A9W6HHZ9_9MICO|nr:GNAT family N-acetyltransferase [Microbacterium imperiale]MBP2421088.1 ribosomal protein S18 acetylase RimI-like enzyme [Microbacterium imperiale]BFE41428.1 GNAT family N-acetyltransferase [Microbacterium imperiale]GLJ80379.1 GNAT family N-acetyltransferase [Microbacterium imperiale]
MTMTIEDVRDNAAWHSLTGAHAHLAIGDDLVRRYPDDVAGFVGVRTWDDPAVWDSLVQVVGSGGEFSISISSDAPDPELPPGWSETFRGAGVQLVETDRLRPRPDDEAVVLGAADVPDMLALVERNRPGPFRPRTHLLGRYIGVRRDGRLIAMAGERLQPGGWTEISAVATDPEYRRQGIASRLVLDVAFHIQQRGGLALMHAAASNANAIAGYEKLGFELRRTTNFIGVRIP